jgi:hypothetical protein
MANPTTNYGFVMPTPTDLVTDLPADFEVFGQDVDSQMKTNADAATQKATLTTTGDIYYASAANTPARLGIGSTDQVLTVSGGVPTWAIAPSGGMTLISTTSLTGASVTLSSIAATYNDLKLVVQDYLPATDTQRLSIRFNGDSGATYASARSTSTGASLFNNTSMELSETQDNAVTNSLIVIDIPNYANTVTWKLATSHAVTVDTTTTTSARLGINLGAYNQTGAISSITLLPFTGNFTSGTVLLYGVK